jgi:hypothetical protein
VRAAEGQQPHGEQQDASAAPSTTRPRLGRLREAARGEDERRDDERAHEVTHPPHAQGARDLRAGDRASEARLRLPTIALTTVLPMAARKVSRSTSPTRRS